MTYQHRSNFSIYFWDHVGKKLKQQTNNIKEGVWCLLWHIYIYIILWYKKRKQHSWNLQNSPEKRKKQSSALKILVLIASRSGFPWSPGKSRSPGKSWSPKFPTKGKAFLPVSGKLITWPWHEYMDAAGFLCISTDNSELHIPIWTWNNPVKPSKITHFYWKRFPWITQKNYVKLLAMHCLFLPEGAFFSNSLWFGVVNSTKKQGSNGLTNNTWLWLKIGYP